MAMDDNGSAQYGALTDKSAVQAEQRGRKLSTLNTSTGKWSLGKTIDMGATCKVKLAKHLETGEQIAVKIFPRSCKETHRIALDREHTDTAEDTGNTREATILGLIHQPHICGMRELVQTRYHWCLLLDYINGGQLLDYIISHGRLKEKGARKFARQLASALDYCHGNNIVHRNICIENIMLSETGDIKLVGFSVSSLFSPQSHLKTFCSSHYFPAPEMLDSKPYIGPEVDVWSFGVVLYVLVCGRVPFDDYNMPDLQQKIKKGLVASPRWISDECKDLISRMLVTDSAQRASLAEIKHHPWMTKGYNKPPENYIPYREPLRLPLDPEVIHNMHSLGFGSAGYITEELTKILLSDDYQHAVRNAQRKLISKSLETERKKGLFGLHKLRNLIGSDKSINLSGEDLRLEDDPMNTFSPLISIYYLVREKLDRKKAKTNSGVLIPKENFGVGNALDEKETTLSSSSTHVCDSRLRPQKMVTTSIARCGYILKKLLDLYRLRSAHRRRLQHKDASVSDLKFGFSEPSFELPSASSSIKSVVSAN